MAPRSRWARGPCLSSPGVTNGTMETWTGEATGGDRAGCSLGTRCRGPRLPHAPLGVTEPSALPTSTWTSSWQALGHPLGRRNACDAVRRASTECLQGVARVVGGLSGGLIPSSTRIVNAGTASVAGALGDAFGRCDSAFPSNVGRQPTATSCILGRLGSPSLCCRQQRLRKTPPAEPGRLYTHSCAPVAAYTE